MSIRRLVISDPRRKRRVRFLFGVVPRGGRGRLHAITMSFKSLTCLVLSARTERPAAVQRAAQVSASAGALASLSTRMVSVAMPGSTGNFAMLVREPIAQAGDDTTPRRIAPNTVSTPSPMTRVVVADSSFIALGFHPHAIV